jgi:hypothetical protein
MIDHPSETNTNRPTSKSLAKDTFYTMCTQIILNIEGKPSVAVNAKKHLTKNSMYSTIFVKAEIIK